MRSLLLKTTSFWCIIISMGIIKVKELHNSIVDADIAPKVETVAIDGKQIETKEQPVETEVEVSGKELAVAGVVLLALAGMALWLMLGK